MNCKAVLGATSRDQLACFAIKESYFLAALAVFPINFGV